MDYFAPINAISDAIRLAVAPVFLITGISAILSVLTVRLGRAVDRARLVERRMARIESDEHRIVLQREVALLRRRIKNINRAMRLAVSSVLLICIVVMSLFIGAFGHFAMGTILAVLFILALLLLVVALLFFLLEVSISTRQLLQSAEHLMPDEDATQ